VAVTLTPLDSGEVGRWGRRQPGAPAGLEPSAGVAGVAGVGGWRGRRGVAGAAGGTPGVQGPRFLRSAAAAGREAQPAANLEKRFSSSAAPPWAGLSAVAVAAGAKVAGQDSAGRGWLIRQETLGSGHFLPLLVTAAPRGRKTSAAAAPRSSSDPRPPHQPPGRRSCRARAVPACTPGLPAVFPHRSRSQGHTSGVPQTGWQKHNRGELAARDVGGGVFGASPWLLLPPGPWAPGAHWVSASLEPHSQYKLLGFKRHWKKLLQKTLTMALSSLCTQAPSSHHPT
jgi:hypothetical protein